MKILITGATGFVGRHLGKRLAREGHTLVVVTRSKSSARKLPYFAQVVECDLTHSELPAGALQGVQAIFHLMGESVSSGRWTSEKKRKILDTRTLSSQNLFKSIQVQGSTVKTLISASAIGFYGDEGEENLTEESPRGTGFIAEVVQAWETQTLSPLSGVRQVAVRIGIVLGKDGGALSKMLPLYRAGFGGRLGSGRQWMSWIHIDDLVGIFHHALTNSKVEGAINGVSPHPVRNTEFSHTLARTMRCPEFLRVPKFALKLLLGEMGSVVLASQKVSPAVAKATGYSFQFQKLDEALQNLVTIPFSGNKSEIRKSS